MSQPIISFRGIGKNDISYNNRNSIPIDKKYISRFMGYGIALISKQNNEIMYFGFDNRTHSSFDSGMPELYQDSPDIYATREDAINAWNKNKNSFYNGNKSFIESSDVFIIEVYSSGLLSSFDQSYKAELLAKRKELEKATKSLNDEIEKINEKLKEEEVK